MTDISLFERGATIYPQPVAVSCGRICRARNVQEQLDSILRCAETLTRYLAVAAISSFAAREDPAVEPPGTVTGLQGNLSFGHFLGVLQGISAVDCAHPLKAELVSGFRKKNGPGPADTSLSTLLKLRNTIGHDLANLTQAQVLTHLEVDKPQEQLKAALQACEALLALPLFLLEEQRIEDEGDIVGRRLLLMGETSDPIPEEIQLASPLARNLALYLGLRDGALRLSPLLLWKVVITKRNFGLYLLHAHDEKQLKFITMGGDMLEQNGALTAELRSRLAGGFSKETVTLKGGQSFLLDWVAKKQTIERVRREMSGVINWHDFDPETVRWYGRQLGAQDDDTVQPTIMDRLLEGRDTLSPDDIRQIILLLGNEGAVRRIVRRKMIDCRVRKDPNVRWDERVESGGNVLECLKLAIGFFSKHTGSGGTTIDGLQAISGSADYIAMREALVNLCIHQDYRDEGTVAQIEITKDRAVFFNAGKSLVTRPALVEGGKSQSRNPLLSRALRLIGFAELAGSGLPAVSRAWRQAKRRPPTIDSNSSANTFTLTLDWREMPDVSDEFWSKKLGVKISKDEATVLLLAAEPPGVTAEEIAASQGIEVEEAQQLIQRLIVQALVSDQNGRILLADRLHTLADEARRAGSGK